MLNQAGIPILQIDAFADEPFTGNPAAVCLPDVEPPADWMQQIAAEMNLSETAFTWPSGDSYGLRWFTPVAEVDLCGHATLATAFALWEVGRVNCDDNISFATRSGVLEVRREQNMIKMNFPAEPATSCESPNGLAEALGAEILWCGQNRMYYLLEVANEQTLLDLRPDFARLARLDTRGVIVTAAAERDNVDFVSRFFCPALGIDEDPVTGSAHCSLAPFWAGRLDRYELTGFQASKRGGVVCCEVVCDRVELSGRAVKIFSGTMSAASAGA